MLKNEFEKKVKRINFQKENQFLKCNPDLLIKPILQQFESVFLDSDNIQVQTKRKIRIEKVFLDNYQYIKYKYLSDLHFEQCLVQIETYLCSLNDQELYVQKNLTKNSAIFLIQPKKYQNFHNSVLLLQFQELANYQTKLLIYKKSQKNSADQDLQLQQIFIYLLKIFQKTQKNLLLKNNKSDFVIKNKIKNNNSSINQNKEIIQILKFGRNNQILQYDSCQRVFDESVFFQGSQRSNIKQDNYQKKYFSLNKVRKNKSQINLGVNKDIQTYLQNYNQNIKKYSKTQDKNPKNSFSGKIDQKKLKKMHLNNKRLIQILKSQERKNRILSLDSSKKFCLHNETIENLNKNLIKQFADNQQNFKENQNTLQTVDQSIKKRELLKNKNCHTIKNITEIKNFSDYPFFKKVKKQQVVITQFTFISILTRNIQKTFVSSINDKIYRAIINVLRTAHLKIQKYTKFLQKKKSSIKSQNNFIRTKKFSKDKRKEKFEVIEQIETFLHFNTLVQFFQFRTTTVKKKYQKQKQTKKSNNLKQKSYN